MLYPEATNGLSMEHKTDTFSSGVYTMPYVNIRVAGTLTKTQKEKISQGVTDVIAKEANKPPETILIFIDEVAHENIAKSGKLMTPPQ